MKWLFLLVALPALAHEPAASRELYIQLRGERVEAVLTLHVPAARAELLFAAPGVRVEGELKINGSAPRIVERHATRLPDGAVEVRLLLDGGTARDELRVEGEVPVRLVAGSGVRVRIAEGAGQLARGGAELWPHKDRPVTVRIERPRAAPPRTRSRART